MNDKKPPAFALWMLRHFIEKGCGDALTGDLLEAFRAGRSAGWFWYQVVTAIAIVWGRNVWHYRIALIFATLWSFISPGWDLLHIRFYESRFYGHIWRLPWPWSTVCDLARILMAPLLFIGLGVGIYLILLSLGHSANSSLGSFWKGLLFGWIAYGLAWAILSAIVIHDPQTARNLAFQAHREWINRRSLTVLGVVESFRTWSALARLPYFAGTATALWFLASREKSERVGCIVRTPGLWFSR